MNDLLIKTIQFARNEEGASAIEYALITALIAMVLIAGVTALGKNLDTWYTNMANTVSGWASGGGGGFGGF
jgi:pilus assembly protein Flp/PilA